MLVNKQIFINLILVIFGGLISAFPNPILRLLHLQWLEVFLPFVIFLPLMFINTNNKIYLALVYGFLFGLFKWGGILSFMPSLPSLGSSGINWYILIVSYYALFMAVFFALFTWLKNQGIPSVFALLIWIPLETITAYSMMGYPNIPPSISLVKLGFFNSIFASSGSLGLTTFVLIVNAFFYLVLTSKIKSFSFKTYAPLIFVFLIIVLTSVYEKISVYIVDKNAEEIKVSVIQTNHVLPEKVSKEQKNNELKHINSLLKKAVADSSKLALFPEASFPGSYGMEPQAEAYISFISRTYGISTLLGVRYTKHNDNGAIAQSNSAAMIDSKGRLVGVSSKSKLFPFMEYKPFTKGFLKFLSPFFDKFYQGGSYILPAEKIQLPLFIDDKIIPIGSIICFESMFSGVARDLVVIGCELLTIISNDNHFKGTNGVEMHGLYSQVQAASTARYVMRSGTIGVSQIVDARGVIVKKADIESVAVITETVKLLKHKTLFVRFGNWIVFLVLGLLLYSFWKFKYKVNLK